MLKTNLTIEEFLPNITGAKKNKWENSFIKEKFYEIFPEPCKRNTIKEYWETFTEPRLPDKDVVLAWHKMLMEYCKMPGAIFAIRAGSSTGKLRRGWLTKTDDDYSYFFADNDFACIIFKMVLQGYCPDLNDFYKSMTEFKYVNEITWCKNSRIAFNDTALNGNKRKFTSIPNHFQRYGGKSDNDKTEDCYNAMLIKSPNPSFGTHGYKHSHLYSTGQKYILNDKEISMKANFDGLFPIGDISDWQWSNDYSNYIRFQNIPAERKADSKAMAIASFLRFIDPLNHFLSPKSKKNGHTYNEYKKADGSIGNDIAEYDELLCYAQEKMHERYGADVYEEFAKFTLAKKFKPANGDLEINVTFSTVSFENNTQSESTDLPTENAISDDNTTRAENNIFSNNIPKIGVTAKKIFTSLLEENRPELFIKQ